MEKGIRRDVTMTQDLVLEHRDTVFRLAQSMLRRWNVHFDTQEVQSIVDLTLCEAAPRFDVNRNVKFTTYIFPMLKGALISTMKESKQQCAMLRHAGTTDKNYGSVSENLDDTLKGERGEHCPEQLTFRSELRARCDAALSELTGLERRVVVGIHMLDFKVAHLARRLGYSRGHLSAIRKGAFQKLRPNFDDYSQAA